MKNIAAVEESLTPLEQQTLDEVMERCVVYQGNCVVIRPLLFSFIFLFFFFFYSFLFFSISFVDLQNLDQLKNFFRPPSHHILTSF